MTHSLKAVLFDLDGVVAETEDVHRRAYNNVFASLGIDLCWDTADYARILPQLAGTKWKQIPMPPQWDDRSRFEREAYQAKRQEYLRLVREDPLPTRPGVRRLLQQLLAAGIAVGAASTSAKEAAEAIVDHLREGPIRPFFQTICAGDDVANKKPAPDIYLLAAEQIGIDPHDCVAIEDTRHGLQSAQNAGMKCIVTPSEFTRDDDFSAADLVVTDLDHPTITPERLSQLW